MLGAISLSGGSDMMHIHTLGLVRQAAETVTSQLRERERIRELAIKNQYMRALVESDSRGIVTVDQTGRIVEANSTARKLLKLSPGCEGKSFEESVGESYNITGYLKEGKGFRAREILARRSGTTHFASLDPIRMNSGELVGGLFTVMEKKEMMHPPIMPIAPKPSQYGIDPSLVKKRVTVSCASTWPVLTPASWTRWSGWKKPSTVNRLSGGKRSWKI